MGNSSRDYKVNLGYEILARNETTSKDSSIWRTIWGKEAPPKINFFCWLLVHGKVLTQENLRKRKIQGPSKCALYGLNEETTEHLFFAL